MKKLLIVIIVIGLSSQAFAQEIDFGIKAGVNFSSISDAKGLDNKTGFVGGIFAGVEFNDNLGVQADLLYSQQGADFDVDKVDLNYVNIPIVLKYFIAQGLNIQAGPQFGFIVDDNVSEVFSGVTEAESFDLTGVVGFGYDLPMGVRIDGRYNFGLTDVLKDTKGKNTVITLSVGYSFL
ncbi:MAG: porin family protein [Flavobacteriaceae bacterium]|nr:porin family protein [Flavobacteriaceae bacterium]